MSLTAAREWLCFLVHSSARVIGFCDEARAVLDGFDPAIREMVGDGGFTKPIHIHDIHEARLFDMILDPKGFIQRYSKGRTFSQ